MHEGCVSVHSHASLFMHTWRSTARRLTHTLYMNANAVDATFTVLPLPFPQLTRLQLWNVPPESTHVLPMIAELPQLEILEVLDSPHAFDVSRPAEPPQLSKMTKLRLINLSGWLMWSRDTPPHVVQTGELLGHFPAWSVSQIAHLQVLLAPIRWAFVPQYRSCVLSDLGGVVKPSTHRS